MSILDTHKIVYVVSFMPSFEGSSIGGFDWYFSENDARLAMSRHLVEDIDGDWTHDYTIRSIPVPKDLSNDEITELLDGELREMREVPLPGEWRQIRNTGGAIELGE